jgi:neutral amino acid transport system permease protein
MATTTSSPPRSTLSVRRRRLAQVLVAFAGALLAPALLSSPVHAQDDAALTIFGTLSYEDESGEDVPLPDVEIEVDGVGIAISDENGDFAIEVPGEGEYAVTLDIETLPPGVSLADPDRASLPALTVSNGRSQRVLFPIVSGEVGGAEAGSSINGRRLAQLTVEGLKTGLYLAMAAIGLSLIFGTTGLVNFAHAELVTWGMLSTYFFNFYGFAGALGFMAAWPAPFGGGVNLAFAGVFGMLAGGLMGWLLNRFIFRNARRAGVGLIAQMVMTIGLSILMRYVFLYYFRGGPRTFGNYAAQRANSIGPIELTTKDLIAMGLSVVILLGVGGYLQLTRMGKAMRAVSDNRELAESSGIDVERVISWVWVSGASLAALGGVFFGLDQVKWDFGFRTLLLLFAAVTLGGLGTAYGALVGALVVGLAIQLSTLFIDAELKNMTALLVMVIILLFRPQGILGRPERIG